MMKVLVSEDIWKFDLEAALKEISAQRREQALKFKHEQGQRLCVLAYQLLKEGLQQEYGITGNPIFEYNEHGKPSIVGHPEIFFNLSHCKEAAICVVNDQPIGVDVEAIREYKDGLAEYTMNENELQQIKIAANPSAAFIRLWTMKEATTKLIGTGISNDMKTVIDTLKYKYTTVERQKYIYTICANIKLLQSEFWHGDLAVGVFLGTEIYEFTAFLRHTLTPRDEFVVGTVVGLHRLVEFLTEFVIPLHEVTQAVEQLLGQAEHLLLVLRLLVLYPRDMDHVEDTQQVLLTRYKHLLLECLTP